MTRPVCAVLEGHLPLVYRLVAEAPSMPIGD